MCFGFNKPLILHFATAGEKNGGEMLALAALAALFRMKFLELYSKHITASAALFANAKCTHETFSFNCHLEVSS